MRHAGILFSLLLFVSFVQAATIKVPTDQSIAFTKNIGQWPDSILFKANANGETMWFTKTGVYHQFFKNLPRSGTVDSSISNPAGKFSHVQDSIETTMIKAEFVGASESAEVIGLEEMDYRCNYFIGNDKAKWRTDVPNYKSITMRGIYSGVDITFSTKGGRLQQEVTASSSDKLAQLSVAYRGIVGKHRFEGALLANESLSKLERQGSSTSSNSSEGVSLVYSTYLGGTSDDIGLGIAVDPMENAYVTGYTVSATFPTQSSFQSSIAGNVDIFITKFNSAGDGLIYSTYVGGTDQDRGYEIAIDSAGHAYITGYLESTNFPIINSFQTSIGGNSDAFIIKINNTGNGLIYSSYLGGSDNDFGTGIAVDNVESAYITGYTNSTNFHLQNSFQSSKNAGYDAFVTKINDIGNGLIYSTYLGGDNNDEGHGIAVDTIGNAYVTGITFSPNFPTQNSLDNSFNGGSYDAFVTKFNNAGSNLIYSTFLGGSSGDSGDKVAIDAKANVYVKGSTLSVDFPLQNPFQASKGGNDDIFITKLNSTGNGLIYSTYFGGSGYDDGGDIAIDAEGNAYITGTTNSDDFSTKNAFQPIRNDSFDAFVTKFSSLGNELIYSTYLGGSGSDGSYGIAVDARGNTYVLGQTASADFPVENPFQTFTGGTYDAFVVKFNLFPVPPSSATLIVPPDSSGKPTFNMLPTFKWHPSTDPDPLDTVRYKLEISLNASFTFISTHDSIAGTQYTLADSLEFGKHYYWRVTAFDTHGLTAQSAASNFWTWTLGDVNHSHATTIQDLTYLVAFLFNGGTPISPLFVGDINGNCGVTIQDLTYLVRYLFSGGPAPKVGCGP